MENWEQRHELLAPAGSYDTFRAVISAGADAVYLGGDRYGARAYAQNFTEEEILKALDYAHLRGRRVFLTVNTMLKNREMGQALYDYLMPFCQNGLDAVIVQDFGVLRQIHSWFPNLPIHASTQMSIANANGAQFLQLAGVSRVIPSRELSLSEISSIYHATGMEIECFVHGALCFSYSGQCLMSSLLGGRSGNRGRCAQPCRFPYQVIDEYGKPLQSKDRFPLSLKDLCALPLLPELCKAGVHSFKIEGRMKSLEYAAGVTQLYRKYLDQYERDPEQYAVDKQDYDQLIALGNRNGFTEGYYTQQNGRSMVTLTKSFHTGVIGKEANAFPEKQTVPVEGSVRVRVGEPLELKLSARKLRGEGTIQILVHGADVLPAKSSPISTSEIQGKIKKCGRTPFYFSHLDIECSNDAFVSVGALNELRRKGLSCLEEALLLDFKHEFKQQDKKAEKADIEENGEEKESAERQKKKNNAPFLHVHVSSKEQLNEALRHSYVDEISLDFVKDSFGKFQEEQRKGEHCRRKETAEEFYAGQIREARIQIQKAGKRAGFCFPFVFRNHTQEYYEQTGIAEEIKQFDTVYVRGYDSLGYSLLILHLSPEVICLDHSLYVDSKETCRAFQEFHLMRYTASYELNEKELLHMPDEGAEIPVYGWIPMMVTAQCLLKNEKGCVKKSGVDEKIYLRDRKGKKLKVQNNCLDCYNVIYNSTPLYLLHQRKAVEHLGSASYRIAFVDENECSVQKILNEYEKSFILQQDIDPPKEEFTMGHFRRGVI